MCTLKRNPPKSIYHSLGWGKYSLISLSLFYKCIPEMCFDFNDGKFQETNSSKVGCHT